MEFVDPLELICFDIRGAQYDILASQEYDLLHEWLLFLDTLPGLSIVDEIVISAEALDLARKDHGFPWLLTMTASMDSFAP